MVISSFISIIQRSIFAESRNNRLIFARDILLSREVAREIKLKKKISPWIDMGNYFKDAAWVMGNFEANVGNSADCVDKSSSLCFAVAAENLNYLKKAGFSAVGVENNHSGDLEKWGRENTIKSLRNARIQALNFMNSPGFLRLGEYTVAFVT